MSSADTLLLRLAAEHIGKVLEQRLPTLRDRIALEVLSIQGIDAHLFAPTPTHWREEMERELIERAYRVVTRC